jgi:hypothetical protein
MRLLSHCADKFSKPIFYHLIMLAHAQARILLFYEQTFNNT